MSKINSKKIIDKKAEYLISVKGNQVGLQEQINKIFSLKPARKIDLSYSFGHGRTERRTCEVIEDLEFMDGRENWAGLASIVRVSSDRTDKKTGNKSEYNRLYISSITGFTARQINEMVRDHWSIENGLHWSLDVVMREDGQKNRTGNSAENMNIVREIVLNMLSIEKTVKKSKT